MPKNLHVGDVVASPRCTYIVESDPFDGGQAKGYFVRDSVGTPYS